MPLQGAATGEIVSSQQVTSGDHLEDPERLRLIEMLNDVRFELIPLSKVWDEVAYLPTGATVTVTASPTKDMSSTLDLTVRLAAEGFRVIPHFSARLTKSRGELEESVARAREAGVTEVFVVGGDAGDPGEYFDGLALIRAMEEIGHPFTHIGFPGYPEGHPYIPDEALQQAVHDKAPSASSITTQMCFDPGPIATWIRAQRTVGVDLPVYLGIPGVASVAKLARTAMRIGVGQSTRFVTSNVGLVGKLVKPGGYSPDELIVGAAPLYVDAAAGVVGFHVYTFNQVETTERWRIAFIDELASA